MVVGVRIELKQSSKRGEILVSEPRVVGGFGEDPDGIEDLAEGRKVADAPCEII